MTIHDNLDSEFLYLHHLAQTGIAFDNDAVIPQVMNGLPRSTLRSGLNVTVALFHLLPSFWALVSNHILVHLVAFLGMYLLLDRHLLPNAARWEQLAIALCFAVIPFYAAYGVSVSGQPLLLYAVLNIAERRGRAWDWLVVLAFPWYSSLVIAGLFIVAGLVAIGVFRVLERQPMRPAYWAACALLAASYAAVEWPLLRTTLFSDAFISHRVEFRPDLFESGTTTAIARNTADTVLHGHYHAGSFFVLPIVGVAMLALIASRSTALARRLALLAAAVVVIAGWHAAYAPIVTRAFGDGLPLLRSVQLDRFYILLPMIWFGALAIAWGSLRGRRRFGSLALVAVTAIVAADAVRRTPEFRFNLPIVDRPESLPSFRKFFATDLFTRIRTHIGRPTFEYRVVSVGMHPAMAQFAGLYTLDSYQNNYPLAYKHDFRAIIAAELARDPGLRRYFDHWGNRCYVFSAEIHSTGYVTPKDRQRPIRELRIDVDALSALGGTHVLSAAAIGNAADVGLSLEGVFESPESFWRIHLYRVRHSRESTTGRI